MMYTHGYIVFFDHMDDESFLYTSWKEGDQERAYKEANMHATKLLYQFEGFEVSVGGPYEIGGPML